MKHELYNGEITIEIKTIEGGYKLCLLSVKEKNNSVHHSVFASGLEEYLSRLEGDQTDLMKNLRKFCLDRHDSTYLYSGVNEAWKEGKPTLAEGLDFCAEFFKFHIRKDDLMIWLTIAAHLEH